MVLSSRRRQTLCPFWIATMLPGEAGEVMERNSFGNIPVEQRDDLLKWKLRQDVRPPPFPRPPLYV